MRNLHGLEPWSGVIAVALCAATGMWWQVRPDLAPVYVRGSSWHGLVLPFKGIETSSSYWNRMKLSGEPSPEWLKMREGCDADVIRMKSWQPVQRIAWFNSFALPYGHYITPPDKLYRVMYSANHFREDYQQADCSQTVYNTLDTKFVSDDVEFVRTAYVYYATGRSFVGCVGYGPKLMKIFPKDEEIKRAFISQCVYSSASVPEWKLALTMLEARESSYSREHFAHGRARLLAILAFELKSKSWLKRAYAAFAHFIRVAATPETKRFAERFLMDIQKVEARGYFTKP